MTIFDGFIWDDPDNYTPAAPRPIVVTKNVYRDTDGTIKPLPFDGGEGLWYFDGQIFYKEPFDPYEYVTGVILAPALENAYWWTPPNHQDRLTS